MATDFRILGELQVVRDGELRDLGPLRQRALLARLILRAGQPLTADRLLDELWPDEAPEGARHTLHVYVSRVRASLGSDRDRIRSDATGYRLLLEPEELDSARFERLAAQGRAALAEEDTASAADLLRRALAQWRGPALVEFADEAFASAEATRLDQLRLAALEDRVWADLALGRHAEVTEELRMLTVEQPYREVPWEQLMLALYRGGRQADALHVFAEARTRLADELGIEPGPALRCMEQRVLAHDATLSPPPSLPVPASPTAVPAGVATHESRPPGNLPLQRTTFVGRERDLAIAAELLATSRLLTLVGAPGAGKTRLALRLAATHEQRYPGGVFLVSLASTSDASMIGPAIAAVLDECDGTSTRDAARRPTVSDALVGRLAGRRALLVLDNLEQLSGPLDGLGELLDTLPGLTVIATSRAPLGLAGEQEFPVLPLQVPPTEAAADPQALAGYDAVALLVARARAADPGFEVTAENAAAIAGITARLDGLPLALELGAGRLRMLTPQSLLERLERRLPLLTSGASDTISRHQTLRAAIAWSYELLEEREQQLFRRLAPFVGGFTLEAAAFVAHLPADETRIGIESLLAKSLLHRPVHTGEARFTMLQTLREYATEQLEQAGELEPTLGRHAGYFLELADGGANPDDEQGREDTVARLLSELEEVRAVLRRATQRDHERELGLHLATATWRVWQAAGRIPEGRELLARLLAVSEADGVARADALVALAGLEYWQADYAAATAAYEEALAICRSEGDAGREADVLYGLSMTATWQGDTAEGARLAMEARNLFEAQGARAKVGEVLMAQGFALWQDRRYTEAKPLWEEALAISRELRADTLAVTQLAGLAGLAFHTGAAEEAVRIALAALDQACDLENVALCVWLLDFVAAFAVEDAPAPAVRVASAADALRRASGGGMHIEDLRIQPARAVADRLLTPAQIERAWSDGRVLSLEEAIDAARGLASADTRLDGQRERSLSRC